MTREAEKQPAGRVVDRRGFLGEAGCSLLGSTAIVNTLLNLRMASSSLAADNATGTDDYKALVCVFLFGGNDSFNMLLPTSPEEYAQYKKTRGNLAVELSGDAAALPLGQSGISGRTFAVHPTAGPLQKLYDAGELAFVANVGTLVEPTTIEQYKRQSVELPKSLFSHNDQRDQWQTSLPQGRGSSGWFGRAADLLHEAKNTGKVSMNISLSGNNLLQTGRKITVYNITPNGSVKLTNKVALDLFAELGAPPPKSQPEMLQRNLFESTFADATRNSIELDRQFSAAFGSVKLKTVFPNNALANSLAAIARTIGGRKRLGLKRQTFFVMLGGWDHHQNLLVDHPALLAVLSESLRAFGASLKELGVFNQVTTFTASDFGRTLRSNGNGSDHAWGGNALVMGGAVKGGKVYGQYPEALVIKGGLDVGTNGRLLPTTSCDEYYCEMMRWFGIRPGDMKDVLPNIESFYDPRSPQSPLGFMRA